ncbi:MAG: hypothetical protein MRY83_04390, partial [Flavobacteriales bacterium]|nr:hypothetical protein [Flavobacteriales bacterium]
MGEVYDEFKEELKVIASKYQNSPLKEMDILLHIALEREELVTTSYRTEFLSGNIEKLPLSKEIKELFRHALIWVWKDEDMHTVYTRGALVKTSSYFERIKIFLSQFQGFVGGWAGSMVQHLKWWQAPIAVSLARFILFMGRISGKVTEGISKEMKFGSFKRFCYFNIDAEKTAGICWDRILVLAKSDPRFDENSIEDFKRIAFDEKRHKRIFQIIYDALDDQDELIEGVEATDIIEKIREVSEYFLPKSLRGKNQESYLGEGGKVWSFRNTNKEVDKTDFFDSAIQKIDLEEVLKEKCHTLSKKIENMDVVIKTTFSMGYDQKDFSPLVDPKTLEHICLYLNKLGVSKIKVIDIDTIYGNFFENRDVNSLAKYYNFQSDYYEVINASK